MITIFFSLANELKDRTLFEELFKQFSIQRRQGLIEVLYDSLIDAGENRNDSIKTFIRRANIIVVLISPDYFHSDQCFEVELQYALERQKAGRAEIIPVLMRPTSLEDSPFEQARLLPSNGQAVESWKDLDLALFEVAKGIHQVVKELKSWVTNATQPIKSLELPLWTLPYRRNPFFTDRDEIMAELYRLFTSEQIPQTSIQALHGMGGIGKTLLAVEYACRHHHEYQAIFWLKATSP